MKYWAYLNDEVSQRSYTESELQQLEGFGPDILVCSEVSAMTGEPEWKPVKELLPHLIRPKAPDFSKFRPKPPVGGAFTVGNNVVTAVPERTIDGPYGKKDQPVIPDNNLAGVNGDLLAQLQSLTAKIASLENKIEEQEMPASNALPDYDQDYESETFVSDPKDEQEDDVLEVPFDKDFEVPFDANKSSEEIAREAEAMLAKPASTEIEEYNADDQSAEFMNYASDMQKILEDTIRETDYHSNENKKEELPKLETGTFIAEDLISKKTLKFGDDSEEESKEADKKGKEEEKKDSAENKAEENKTEENAPAENTEEKQEESSEQSEENKEDASEPKNEEKQQDSAEKSEQPGQQDEEKEAVAQEMKYESDIKSLDDLLSSQDSESTTQEATDDEEEDEKVKTLIPMIDEADLKDVERVAEPEVEEKPQLSSLDDIPVGKDTVEKQEEEQEEKQEEKPSEEVEEEIAPTEEISETEEITKENTDLQKDKDTETKEEDDDDIKTFSLEDASADVAGMTQQIQVAENVEEKQEDVSEPVNQEIEQEQTEKEEQEEQEVSELETEETQETNKEETATITEEDKGMYSDIAEVEIPASLEGNSSENNPNEQTANLSITQSVTISNDETTAAVLNEIAQEKAQTSITVTSSEKLFEELENNNKEGNDGISQLIGDNGESQEGSEENSENDDEFLKTFTTSVEEVFLDQPTAIISDYVPPNTDGAEHVATPAAVENNIKREKPSDIKTVPLVPEALGQEIWSSPYVDSATAKLGKTSVITNGIKWILLILVFAAISLMALSGLALMGVIPEKLSPIHTVIYSLQKTPQAKTAQSGEDLEPEMIEQNESEMQASQSAKNSVYAVLDNVEDYTFSDGTTLRYRIENSHKNLSGNIEWSMFPTEEQNVYSIAVKIPQNKDGQGFSYRFNYNANENTLTPTTSEAKNIIENYSK